MNDYVSETSKEEEFSIKIWRGGVTGKLYVYISNSEKWVYNPDDNSVKPPKNLTRFQEDDNTTSHIPIAATGKYKGDIERYEQKRTSGLS